MLFISLTVCIKDGCGDWGVSHDVCHMIGAAQLELANLEIGLTTLPHQG